MPAPLVPCHEPSRWVINGLTAVEFTRRWDVDVGSPLGEFLVGHGPSGVWRFGLALIKSSPLFGWGEFEVAHLDLLGRQRAPGTVGQAHRGPELDELGAFDGA
jgi:hypothetical protein